MAIVASISVSPPFSSQSAMIVPPRPLLQVWRPSGLIMIEMRSLLLALEPRTPTGAPNAAARSVNRARNDDRTSPMEHSVGCTEVGPAGARSVPSANLTEPR